MQKKPFFYGWYVVGAAFFTMMVTVGLTLYNLPFFYEFFIDEFGWTDTQATRGFLIGTLLVLPFGGFLIHRFSARKLIIAGALMQMVAFNSFGLMGGSLFLYYFVWCSLMAGFLYSGPIPHQVILSQWFQRKRGTAFGIAYLGLGLGGAIAQKYVALPLIDAYGWRIAMQGVGSVLLLVVPVVFFIVRDRPAEKGLQPDGAAEPPPEAAVESLSFGDLFRKRSFWLLAMASFCSIGAIGAVGPQPSPAVSARGTGTRRGRQHQLPSSDLKSGGEIRHGTACRPFQQEVRDDRGVSVRRAAGAVADDH